MSKHYWGESFISESSFDALQDSESIKTLRRALGLPLITIETRPCMRCKEPTQTQVKSGRRKTWHCRYCLNNMEREQRGIGDCFVGK